MKKLFFMFMVILITLLPTGLASAQNDNPPYVPYNCQPEFIVSELTYRAEMLEDLSGVISIGTYLIETVTTCAEAWVQLLMDMVASMFDLPINPDGITAFDPYDGVLTPEEAEMVIQAAVAGDVDTANQYLCPEEQLDPPHPAVEIEPVEINSLDCYTVTEGMACDASFTTDGETVDETVIFEVIDGQLCQTLSD